MTNPFIPIQLFPVGRHSYVEASTGVIFCPDLILTCGRYDFETHTILPGSGEEYYVLEKLAQQIAKRFKENQDNDNRISR